MRALPFSDFIELLRAKGFGVGLHEHLAVGKLLEHWESADRNEFRNALAALVARHEGEAQAIRALFDEYYPQPPPEPIVVPKKAPVWLVSWLGRRTTWIAVVFVCAVAAGVVFAERYYRSGVELPLPPTPLVASVPPGPLPVPSPGVAAPLVEPAVPDTRVQFPPDPPAPDLGPPTSRLNWPWIAALGGTVLLVSLVAFWGAGIRRRARQWTLDAWQRALASLPGPFHAPLVLRDLMVSLPRADVDDASTLLARTFAGVGHSKVLDVSRTLRATMRVGLPTMVFRARRVQQPILVLVDVSQTMSAHEARVNRLLADFGRQGVRMERWVFDGDVRLVSQRPHGPQVGLEALAKRYEDWPLMVFSSGLGLAATLTLEDRGWLKALKSWTRRVWISPIRDPSLWPAVLERIPIPAVPLTRDGLLEAARIVAHGGPDAEDAAARAREAVPVVTVAHVETLRRLTSVVPYPTIAELELLRQRFAPGVPDAAVFHVAERIDPYAGAPIRMSDGEIREHLRQLRKDSPQLEADVRRYLLEVLADSEPTAGSAAHLRWEISRAIHEIELAEVTSTDREPALSKLQVLAQGPLWRELRHAVERLPPSGEPTAEIRRAVGLGTKTPAPPAFRDQTGTLPLRQFRWSAPRWQEATAAAVVAIVVAAGATVSGWFRVQPNHVADAYILEYQPAAGSAGVLRIALRDRDAAAQREGVIPRVVRLYRDAQVAGTPVRLQGADASAIVPLEAGSEPHTYQVRADLGDGAYGLSNVVWAPSVLIVIDAQPWARVTVRSAAGIVPALTQTTPAALRIPEGTYDLSFENDGVTSPHTAQITVTATGQRVFRFDMPNFDPASVLRQLGLDAPPAAAR